MCSWPVGTTASSGLTCTLLYLSAFSSDILVAWNTMSSSLPSFYLMIVLYSSCKFPLRRFLHVCVLSRLSHVQLYVTLWTVAHQAPLSIGFSIKNTGVGCHALLQGDLPDPGIGPESFTSPALVRGFFTTSASWGSLSSLILEEVRDSVEQPLKSQ